MADAAQYVTIEGFEAPRAADFLPVVRDATIDELAAQGEPTDIDWDRDVVWGVITAVVATLLGDLAEGAQAVWDARDPNNATGLPLDTIGAISGVSRLLTTHSQATCTCTNSTASPIVIPAGKIVEGGGDDDRAQWRLLADLTVPASSTADGTFEALESGEIDAIATAIDAIVTPVAGWSAVSNAAAAVAGREDESNADYRLRRALSLQTGGRSIASLRGTLLALDGVTHAVVAHNPSPTTATVDGITVSPHAVRIVLYPSTMTAAQQEAAALEIYQSIPYGTGLDGAVSHTVSGPGLTTDTISWDWATTQAVALALESTVIATGFTLSEVTGGVENAYTALMSALAVGDDVRILAACGAVAAVDGLLSATVKLDGGVIDIPITFGELAIEGTVTVTA